MLCAIRYHLYNLKSVKNIHGDALHLVKSQVPSWIVEIVEMVPNHTTHHIFET